LVGWRRLLPDDGEGEWVLAGVTAELWGLARVVERFRVGERTTFQALSLGAGNTCRLLDETGRQIKNFDIFHEAIGLVGLLDEEWRVGPDRRRLVTELTVWSSGEFTVQYSFDLDLPFQLGMDIVSPQLILDPNYRNPGHTGSGTERPPNLRTDRAPTDPHTLVEVQRLVDAYAARYTRLCGHPPDFPRGYSEEELAAAEAQLGFRLPEDLRAVYRTMREDPDIGLLGRFCHLPLDQVVEYHRNAATETDDPFDSVFDITPVVFEAYPYGRMQRVSRNDWWVTVASNYGGDYWAIDMDPAHDGVPGQLFEHGRDTLGRPRYAAASVLEVLRAVAASGDEGWTPEEGGRLWPPESFDFGVSLTSQSRSITVNARGLAAGVADIDNPELIQEVIIHAPDLDIDLRELSPLSSLRDIRVTKARHVELTVPRELPVESVNVTAAGIGVASLAGHPTVWRLILSGNNAAAVDITPLTITPALSYLDLAQAEIVDAAPLASIPLLRALSLNVDQWRTVRQPNLARRLAAARLQGPAYLAQAITWINAVRGSETANSVSINGSLTNPL
jgi:cell wall assembly regulator SMI1